MSLSEILKTHRTPPEGASELTPRYKAFAREWVKNGFDEIEAYKTCFPAVSRRTAVVNAKNTLKVREVQEEIARVYEDFEEETGLTPQKILESYVKLLSVDVGDLFISDYQGYHGRLNSVTGEVKYEPTNDEEHMTHRTKHLVFRGLDHLTAAQRGAITKLKVKNTPTGDQVEVEIHDKLAVLNAIIRFREVLEGTGSKDERSLSEVMAERDASAESVRKTVTNRIKESDEVVDGEFEDV